MLQNMKAAHLHDCGDANNEFITIEVQADEKTPLLQSAGIHGPNISKGSKASGPSARYCDCKVLGITALLFGGLTIATYLLIVETRLPSVSFALDLVNRDVWSRAVVSLGKMINETKILHILVLHTGGEICTELDGCVDLLRDMQKSHGQMNVEIPYNFLIGGDGQTYEVRGWNHESGFDFLPQQSSLVIGFIGNYTSTSPTDVQCTSALSVINESVRRKKLHNSYRVFGLRNLSISHYDGEALFNRISKWQRFDTLLHVL